MRDISALNYYSGRIKTLSVYVLTFHYVSPKYRHESCREEVIKKKVGTENVLVSMLLNHFCLRKKAKFTLESTFYTKI